MGNMEALVTLVFFKIKSLNLASWGILMQIFQKVIYFQIESFYSRPCNFAIFERISSEFGRWCILTYSLNFQHFISIVSFPDTL